MTVKLVPVEYDREEAQITKLSVNKEKMTRLHELRAFSKMVKRGRGKPQISESSVVLLMFQCAKRKDKKYEEFNR